jgi:hypothetical protein
MVQPKKVVNPKSLIQVVYCLKATKPYSVNTDAVAKLIDEHTNAKVITTDWEKPINIFQVS